MKIPTANCRLVFCSLRTHRRNLPSTLVISRLPGRQFESLIESNFLWGWCLLKKPVSRLILLLICFVLLLTSLDWIAFCLWIGKSIRFASSGFGDIIGIRECFHSQSKDMVDFSFLTTMQPCLVIFFLFCINDENHVNFNLSCFILCFNHLWTHHFPLQLWSYS